MKKKCAVWNAATVYKSFEFIRTDEVFDIKMLTVDWPLDYLCSKLKFGLSNLHFKIQWNLKVINFNGFGKINWAATCCIMHSSQ